MVKIFISYARDDQDFARKLYSDLKASGGTPWIDKHDLLPGQLWEEEIPRVMRNADYIVLLFSKHSASKQGYFQKEIRLAIEELDRTPPDQVRLIPALIEKVELKHRALEAPTWLEFFPSYDEALRKLKLTTGLQSPESTPEGLEEFRTLLHTAEQNLLKYKLAQTVQALKDPLIFDKPAWRSFLVLKTPKSKRRLNETIFRIQEIIPIMHFHISEQNNGRFLLRFKHILEYGGFDQQLRRLLAQEGVEVISTETKREEIPKDSSALIIGKDPTELMLRDANGRLLFSSEEGVFF